MIHFFQKYAIRVLVVVYNHPEFSFRIGVMPVLQLIVTEKSSVARTIAKVLGAQPRRDGYLESDRWLVSRCIVHLLAPAAGGRFWLFLKRRQRIRAQKETLDLDLDYTEDKGDFEVPAPGDDADFSEDEKDNDPV